MNSDKYRAQMNRMNLLILIVVIATVFLVSTFVMKQVSRTASMRLAHSYSLDAVETFRARMAGDLALLRLATQQPAVQQWFIDDADEAKKQAAYVDLMKIAPALQNMEYYAGMVNSLNEYAFGGDANSDDLAPHAVMEYGNPWDLWFFELIESDRDFLFNIDIDRVARTWRIWINYKVFHDGEVAGVLCTPIGIDEVLMLMFEDFNDEQVMGYVIDSSGFIHMDSSTLAHYTVLHEEHIKDEFDLPVHISSVDAALSTFVNDFVKQDGMYFTDASRPETIALSSSYASVAPIANSDWMVVTVYDGNTLFPPLFFLPFAIVFVIAVAVYAITNFALTERFVLRPLVETNEVMHDLICIDSLTEIRNRRYLDETLPNIINHLRRVENGELSVLMIDVDYFKLYNDTYGHGQGDECLKRVAQTLAGALYRATDIAARYGGEEFTIILPHTGKAGAMIVAEKLLLCVRELGIAHKKSPIAPYVTISVGVVSANISAQICDWHDYVKKADEALYVSKKNGRNTYTYLDFILEVLKCTKTKHSQS